MATKYVSRVTVMRNGTRLGHLKNFKEGEQEYRKEADLMGGSGSVETAAKYKFSLDYAIPKTGAKTDWLDVEDETWVVERDGGGRVTYSGVDCLKKGEVTYDAQQEAVIPLEFIATSRDED